MEGERGGGGAHGENETPLMLAVVALLPLPLCSLPPYRVRAVQWRVQCWLLRAPVLAGALRHPARHLPRCVCGWGGGWRGTVLREGSPRGGSTMNTAHSLLTPIRLCTCPQPPPPSPNLRTPSLHPPPPPPLPPVQDELYFNGAVVLPHKEMKESVPTPAIIL